MALFLYIACVKVFLKCSQNVVSLEKCSQNVVSFVPFCYHIYKCISYIFSCLYGLKNALKIQIRYNVNRGKYYEKTY